MANVTWAEPTEEALRYIAANMKDEDRREVIGCVGDDILGELHRSVRWSEWSRVCLMDGVPCAVFGIERVSPVDNSLGLVWLLTTEETVANPMFTGRATKNALRHFCDVWETLYNYCDAGNVLVLRWLKFLGAKIYPAAPYGLWGRLYHRFEFTRAGLMKRYRRKDRFDKSKEEYACAQ